MLLQSALFAALLAYLGYSNLKGKQFIVEHVGDKNINNGYCRTLHVTGATEDVVVDETNNLAYITSSSESNRFKWFPGLGTFEKDLPRPTNSYLNTQLSHDGQNVLFNASRADPYRDEVFLFDPATETFKNFDVQGYDGKDLVLHGLALRTWTPGVNTLYCVNHQRSGSVVSIFEHRLEESGKKPVLHHIRDVKHSKVYTPNSVAPVSPTRFFITNDHFFLSGRFRHWEGQYSPLKSTNVVMCDFSTTGSDAQCSVAGRGFIYANGIEYIPSIEDPNSGTIAVAQTLGGDVQFYDYSSTKGTLTFSHSTIVGSGLDNVRRIPGTRDLAVAGFPNPLEAVTYIEEGSTYKHGVSTLSSVLKGSENWKTARVAFQSDGIKEGLGFVTGTIFVPSLKKFIGGSCSMEGLLVCDIDYERLNI